MAVEYNVPDPPAEDGWNSAASAFMALRASAGDSRARGADERYEEMYIVQRQKARAEHLLRHEEVTEVGAREAAAGGAVTGRVERAGIVAELGPADVHPAGGGERGAVSAHARRGDAVEEVDAAADAFQEVLREPHTHEVPGARGRERGVHRAEYFIHHGLLLPHGQPADGVATPVVHGDCLGGHLLA